MLRALLALAAAALAASVVPASAAAQVPASDVPVDPGVSEASQVVLCGTDFLGGAPIVVEGAKGFVALPLLGQPPRVGEVFYAFALVGAIGDSCVTQLAHVEVLPPVGVELAISAQTPVVCEYGDGTTTTPVSVAEGCPQAGAAGLHGVALNRTTRADGLWELPLGRTLTLKVPLRATRPLAGLGGGTPSCARLRGAPPCRPDQAGDSLQVATWVLDGQGDPWLVPYNALTAVAAPGAPATTPAPGAPPATSGGLLRRAPRSLRIASALRGVRVTVAVPADASRVTAVLRARLRGVRGGVLARASVTRARAGDLRLRLRPTAAARRALRRARRVTATLRVTVTPRGGRRQVATARVVLRR